MYIVQGIISGIVATIIFDLFNISLNFAYNIDKPKWNFLGRYFLGYKEGRYVRNTLKEDDAVENELLWGYGIHYMVGIIFGLFYVFLNLLFFNYPSLLIAYFVGFFTVLGAWCFLMPFAYNLGFFASKTDDNLNTSILVDSFEGKKLNSPNDVCVKSDDTIWFTDRPYGILSDYEDYKADQEYDGCYVFKFDPHKKNLEVMTTNLDRPNGIAFSNDEKKLYVADTGENVKCLYVFDVIDNKIYNQKLVYDFKPFFSDGFRCDKDGNIWTSAGKAIKCFNPKNELIGQILVPELVSNLEFGGKEGNILYVTATSSLYKMEVNQIGARYK